jgi:glycine cleavage system aminomethyltransferase T
VRRTPGMYEALFDSQPCREENRTETMTQHSILSTQNPPRARTPLHQWHVAHDARFVEMNGWQVPSVYTTIEKEIDASHCGLGITDVSACGKISLIGPGIATLVHQLLGPDRASKPGDVARFNLDAAVLACRLAKDQLLLLTSSTELASLEQRLAGVASVSGCVQTDVTSSLAGICMLGPRTAELLRQLIALELPMSNEMAGGCVQTNVAGVHGLLIRPPKLAIPAVLLYVAWDSAEYVWERLWVAGARFGVTALGVEACRQTTNDE